MGDSGRDSTGGSWSTETGGKGSTETGGKTGSWYPISEFLTIFR